MAEPGRDAARVTVRDLRDLDDMDEIMTIRHAVFVVEQGVTHAVDGDPHDRYARHVVGLVDGVIVGTGRLHITGREGQIAWVAVLPEYRRLGVGRAIMRHLLDEADQAGLSVLYLNAQTHARRFYEHLGFHVVGPSFVMGGIEHQLMARSGGGAQSGASGDGRPG
jgi:predicted GNAT family N-acyltransferase